MHMWMRGHFGLMAQRPRVCRALIKVANPLRGFRYRVQERRHGFKSPQRFSLQTHRWSVKIVEEATLRSSGSYCSRHRTITSIFYRHDPTRFLRRPRSWAGNLVSKMRVFSCDFSLERSFRAGPDPLEQFRIIYPSS